MHSGYVMGTCECMGSLIWLLEPCANALPIGNGGCFGMLFLRLPLASLILDEPS